MYPFGQELFALMVAVFGKAGAALKPDLVDDKPSDREGQIAAERTRREEVEAANRRRSDLVEKVLKGVLEAEKQHDEKAGRILTAITFLTAASAALYVKFYDPKGRTAGLPSPLRASITFAWGHLRRHPLPQWLGFFLEIDLPSLTFMAYFFFVLCATILLLFALEPGLIIPPWLRGQSSDRPPDEGPIPVHPTIRSLTFYAIIARIEPKVWVDYWYTRGPEPLREEVEASNIRECQMVAIRARSKVIYISLAIWFLYFGISSLVPFIVSLHFRDRNLIVSWTMIGWLCMSLVFVLVDWFRAQHRSRIFWRLTISLLILGAYVLNYTEIIGIDMS